MITIKPQSPLCTVIINGNQPTIKSLMNYNQFNLGE